VRLFCRGSVARKAHGREQGKDFIGIVKRTSKKNGKARDELIANISRGESGNGTRKGEGSPSRSRPQAPKGEKNGESKGLTATIF